MYSREDETGWKQSAAFKKAFSIDVDIQLLAVWFAGSDLVLIGMKLRGVRDDFIGTPWALLA